MSVKTPVFAFDTPVLGEIADVPADLLSLATEIENILKDLDPKFLKTAGAGDANKLLIVSSTGDPVVRAMSGDATISELGVITVGNEKISTAKMAALAVTEAILGNESVATGKVKALAITAAKLAAEAVETAKIANLAVTEGKLAALAVSTAKLAEAAVTADKIAKIVREELGINSTGEVRRGKSIIATEETRTNAAFGVMTTPDQVSNIVVPNGGLIKVLFSAIWSNSVENAGRAAIFVGAEQYRARVRVPTGASPAVVAARGGALGDRVLASAGIHGLASSPDQTPNADTSVMGIGLGQPDSNKSVIDVNNGESYETDSSGGETTILAPAGTYNITIQYKSASGNVKVRSRKMYVWVDGF